jgi:NAD(P)-dependent dehydrogenase (short-subunit alcohol dehydrogenase family)
MTDASDSMQGKICLVTGASGGIGFYTARGLASKGAHVIIVGHHRGRGENARQRINEAVGEGAAEFMLADLSSQDDIRRFLDDFQQAHPHLDVLVNNVGGAFVRRRETADELEMTFALNHLGYFAVTCLLLDTLRASAPSRIVNVASESHRNAQMHWDDLQFERGYNTLRAYGQSKLANLLFTYELDRRLGETGVTVNALHPGFVHTNIGKQHWLARIVMNVVHALFAKPPDEGAQTSIYLASSPEVEGVSGKYFIDKQPVASSDRSYDEAAARRLWEISEELTGIGCL